MKATAATDPLGTARRDTRPRWIRVGVVIGVVAIAACCLSAFAAAGTQRHAANPVLTIADNTPPVSIDPSKDFTTFFQYRVLTNSSIIHIEPNGTFGPGLATSWHYFSTGRGPNKDFEFTLRHNARFSDGTPVTAQAVVTWLNYFSKGTGALVAEMGPIRTINAVGKWTVQIHLNSPNPIIPYLLSEVGNWGAVSSPASVANPSSLTTQTFGAGPYMLDPSQTVSGSEYTFVPNPHYWNPKAIYWSKVVLKIIPDPSSLLDAIKTGQVDVAVGDVTTAPSAKAAGLTVLDQPYGAGGLLFVDRSGHVSKPLADPRVRQALNYAVDRKTVCSALYGSLGSSATSAMPSIDASLPVGQKFYTYDPAKAKALLAAAGYPNGFEFKMLAYAPLGIDGTELPQAVAKYFQNIGVKMDVTTATTAGQYVAARASLQYPVVSNTLGLRILLEDFNFAFLPAGSLNPFHENDGTLDKYWVEALKASQAKTYLDQMAGRINSQAYTLNVCNKPRLWYVSKNIRGAVVNGYETGPFASELRPK